jgi:hypothetical protein
LKAVTLSSNPGGQAVEYAKNTSNAAPSSGWQESTTFSSLSPNTDYYFFARAKENTTYTAGAASSGTFITLAKTPVVNTGHNATVTYASGGINLVGASSLFANGIAFSAQLRGVAGCPRREAERTSGGRKAGSISVIGGTNCLKAPTA